MRILHTADWHLGHSLHNVSRDYEHACFLAWLLDVLEQDRIDALVVAGDVFDGSNPSAVALNTWYEFLAEARKRLPELDMVFVAGNHDSPARLEAPAPILRAFGVRVIGSLRRSSEGVIDAERMLVPLRGSSGEIEAWCAAVPYLRPVDLPMGAHESTDPLIEGVRAVYEQVLLAARLKKEPGQALIATGHLYMTRGLVSELSERTILGGHEHAVPGDVFAEELAYVALGHLHLPQTVHRLSVRYAGAPIPLSLSERDYPHQVCVVDLEQGRLTGVQERLVPRSVPILRIPSENSEPLPEVLDALQALDDLKVGPGDPSRPYLEVRVKLDRPTPGVREQIESTLRGKAPRLLRLGFDYVSAPAAGAADTPRTSLREANPEWVFRRCCRTSLEGEPSPELLEAFRTLVREAQAEST